jgi:hypothetical protein
VFCTDCGSLNPDSTHRCLSCGSRLRNDAPVNRDLHLLLPSSRRRLHLIDAGRLALLIVPFSIAVLVGGWIGWQTYADREDRASAYARASAALGAGDYELAIEQFGKAGSYRDAPEQRITARELLAPYRAAYLDGMAAVEAGDYRAAVEVLRPVVETMPNDREAAELMKKAEAGFLEDLGRDADIAMSRGDWLGADRALSALKLLDPENATVDTKLSSLRLRHAPLIFARNGALYQVGPDLADERMIFDDLPVAAPVWNPDRSLIAFYSTLAGARTFGSLFVVDADGNGLRLISQVAFVDSLPSWSPDGKRLAFIGLADPDLSPNKSAPHIFELDSGTDRTIDVEALLGGDPDPSAGFEATSPSFSPAGDRLAFVGLKRPTSVATGVVSFSGTVVNVNSQTGELDRRFDDATTAAAAVSWSPVAEQLLVWEAKGGAAWSESHETAIHLVDLQSGAITRLTASTQTPGRPSWAPDGGRFVFVDGNSVVRVRWPAGLREASIGAPREIREELSWAPGGGAIVLSPADPTEPASIVPMPDGPGTLTDLPVIFDGQWPNVGLQWGPRTLPDDSLLSPFDQVPG